MCPSAWRGVPSSRAGAVLASAGSTRTARGCWVPAGRLSAGKVSSRAPVPQPQLLLGHEVKAEEPSRAFPMDGLLDVPPQSPAAGKILFSPSLPFGKLIPKARGGDQSHSQLRSLLVLLPTAAPLVPPTACPWCSVVPRVFIWSFKCF